MFPNITGSFDTVFQMNPLILLLIGGVGFLVMYLYLNR